MKLISIRIGSYYETITSKLAKRYMSVYLKIAEEIYYRLEICIVENLFEEDNGLDDISTR